MRHRALLPGWRVVALQEVDDQSGFYPSGARAVSQLIEEIADLVGEGVLATSPGTKYPFEQIPAAVTEVESVAHSGKVLLLPDGRPADTQHISPIHNTSQ